MGLNNYQLAILNTAAAADKNIAALLKKFDNKSISAFDRNIIYGSLLDAFDYWSVRLALGKEEADKIKEEYNILAHLEAQQLIEEWREMK